MSVDYQTYVGPYFRIVGDASSFFHETHVDRLIEISEDSGMDTGDGAVYAISNLSGAIFVPSVAIAEDHTPGFYADRDHLGVWDLYDRDPENEIEAVVLYHAEDLAALRAIGCDPAVLWGVISWAS